jgi:hypothetical protein
VDSEKDQYQTTRKAAALHVAYAELKEAAAEIERLNARVDRALRIVRLTTGNHTLLLDCDDQYHALPRRAIVEPMLRRRGLSAAAWAKAARLDPSVVYDYLADKRVLRADSRTRLARALGVEPNDLPE